MRRLRRSFFARPSTAVAPEMLNKLLVSGESIGRIVEVEAYMPNDPASHAFRGRTRRNATMFGKAGLLYVYFTYGIHHCANVVTGSIGDGQAVLLRAVTPVAGIDELRARRPGRADRSLADGPGKLCQAFGLDLRHAGVDLCAGESSVFIGDDGVPPPAAPRVGRRVGISVAVDMPWRWRVSAS